MAIQRETIIHQHGGTDLHSALVYDDARSQPLPVVMVAHAWAGRGENEMRRAEALAELGYAAFAIDLYGGGKIGTSKDQNAALMQPFLDDRAMLRDRMNHALETARGLDRVDPARTAAIGYCFGGLCVLDLARSGADVAATVSFHGLLTPPTPLETRRVRAKVLVLHGHDDPMAPPDHVLALQRELTEAGADWQVHVYGNTMHAFTNPAADDPAFGTVYDRSADRRSWRSMRSLFDELWAGACDA